MESPNRSLRKVIKTRIGFSNEEAALKLLFLALRQAAKNWIMPIHHWREALNHFTILWPEQMRASHLYSDGPAKGNCPLPRHPISKNKTWSLTQKVWTHLANSHWLKVNFVSLKHLLLSVVRLHQCVVFFRRR